MMQGMQEKLQGSYFIINEKKTKKKHLACRIQPYWLALLIGLDVQITMLLQ